jgi:hypothetical protein
LPAAHTMVASLAASGAVPTVTVAKYFAGFLAAAAVPYYFVNVKRVFGGARSENPRAVLRALAQRSGAALDACAPTAPA